MLYFLRKSIFDFNDGKCFHLSYFYVVLGFKLKVLITETSLESLLNYQLIKAATKLLQQTARYF